MKRGAPGWNRTSDTRFRKSVAAGTAIARQLGSADLLIMVRDAFVHAMGTAFLVCAATTIAGAVLALLFMPRRLQASSGAGVDARARAVGGSETAEDTGGPGLPPKAAPAGE